MVQVLQVGEGRHVPGDDFVRYEVFELRSGDLEACVDLVGGLVLGRTVGQALAAEVVHRATEPGVFDGQELDVGARYILELERQVGHDVAGRQIVEPGDEGGAHVGDVFASDGAGGTPGVDGRVQVTAVPGDGFSHPGEEFDDACPIGFGVDVTWFLATGSHDGTLVGHLGTVTELLECQVEHDLERVGETLEVAATQTAEPLALGGELGDASSDRELRDEATHVVVGYALGTDPTLLAEQDRGRVEVAVGQGLAREVAVGDEAAETTRVVDVAAPQGVNADDGVGHDSFESGQWFLGHMSLSGFRPSTTRVCDCRTCCRKCNRLLTSRKQTEMR